MPGATSLRLALDDGDLPRLPGHTTARAALRGSSTSCVELGLLGGFRLSRDGEHAPLPASSRRLIALLALRERPVTRSHVAGVLWGDASEDRAAGSIRTVLWSLRKQQLPIVEAQDGMIWLSPTLDVDTRRMTAAARALLDDNALPDGDLDTSLFLDDLLPDWYDDWLTPERERLRQLRLHALEALCTLFVSTGQVSAAVQTGLTAVNAEPLRESANRALIQAYLAEGNRSDAIRHLRAFSRLLGKELGLRPTQSLIDLVTAGC